MQRPVTTDQDAAIVPVKIGDTARGFRLRNTPMRDPDGRLIGAITLLEEATEIRRIDRLKDEFISVASNKLRAPLHALRMALHAVAEGGIGELGEEQAELVWSARQDADQLDDLVNDLVELAEIEAGRRTLSIERLRVVDAARSVIERHRSLAESKHIELSNNIWSDMYVMADREALKRILDNLVSNAIRHTERGGKVTLESWLRHDAVFIAIKNTGEGIPPEHLPEIFGRFVHSEGFSGATGLGLALVKRLVEVQGGQVAVESRLGEGATFTFSVPEAGSKNSR
jgi:signal transduction histidine kinase